MCCHGTLTLVCDNGLMLAPLAREIQTERRSKTRYPLHLSLRYRTGAFSGMGETLNVSSSGLWMACQHRLEPGAHIEVCLAWPYSLDGEVPLQLALRGRIVRVTGAHCGIVFHERQFRTAKHKPAWGLRLA